MKTLSAYVSGGVWRLPPPHAAFGISLVAFKTVADAASKAVTLVVTVAAARVLTTSDFGVMALAMTTGWLLGVASDAGLPMYAATRVAHARAAGVGAYPIAREILRWRMGLASAAAAVAVLIALALVPTAAVLAFTLIVLHQLFGAMLDTVAHVYRGLGRTDVESTMSLAHRGAIACGALTMLAVAPSLLTLAVALVVPPVLALLASAFILPRLAAPGPSFTLTTRDFRYRVAPLGLGVLLSALYFRIDVYFLERLHGVELVGAYNAAFRIVDALRLVPAAGLAVAYPVLCAATDHRPLRKLSAAFVGASLVVAVAVHVFAGPLLGRVYGQRFATAGPALQVLAWALPFFFLNYALTYQLIAWGRERAYLGITATALATNITLNALFIPSGQMVGAAYATLITELVVCGGCVRALRRR